MPNRNESEAQGAMCITAYIIVAGRGAMDTLTVGTMVGFVTYSSLHGYAVANSLKVGQVSLTTSVELH
jgi:hypothetical protein